MWAMVKSWVSSNFELIFKDTDAVKPMLFDDWKNKYDFRRRTLIE